MVRFHVAPSTYPAIATPKVRFERRMIGYNKKGKRREEKGKRWQSDLVKIFEHRYTYLT